ncbi:hypothetical protein [Planococcus sp. S3-L1]|uniref:hypothetical protein n=1 Tax=Planococcus sp. S3-L1 TaxID=3046200 RepID=UPI0024BA109B|nr:hypothetical protein [Planococcus sp. S3-L1]MDJ0333565.1 hypothetical protein [Planococcus sp. S3-L1]
MKEVLSVPGGKTKEIVKKYLIHAHPHPRSYKNAQYLTIRENGGIMDTLYSVRCEFVLRPFSPEWDKAIKFLHKDIQRDVTGYITERAADFGFGEKEEYKFYLLNVEKELNHLPRTSGPIQGHTYFTLGELTSGREIVLSESLLNKK